MFACSHCGNQLPDGASFCNQCWKTVDASATAADAPAADATAVTAAVDPGPPADAPSFQAPLGAPGGAPDLAPPGYPSAPPPPASPWSTPAPDATQWGPPADATQWNQPASAPPPAQPWAGAPAPAPGWGAPPPPPAVPAYGAGGYAPPPYSPYGAYYAPPTVGTNGMAIASLVCSLGGFVLCGFTGILGVIFGHIALSQIKKTGANGRGMAIAGLVIGYLFIALFAFIIIAALADSGTSSGY